MQNATRVEMLKDINVPKPVVVKSIKKVIDYLHSQELDGMSHAECKHRDIFVYIHILDEWLEILEVAQWISYQKE